MMGIERMAGIAWLTFTAAGFGSLLTVRTGDLQVTLDSEAAWTICSVRCGDSDIIIPAGGQGTVIMEQDGTWVGSGMKSERHEMVTHVRVSVDGNELAGQLPEEISGTQVLIRKESRLGPFEHTAVTVIGNDGIEQTHRFCAREQVDLKTFYAFIYSFEPKAKAWLAGGPDGRLLRGEFRQDGGHQPGNACGWLAQYNPDSGKGALILLGQAAVGKDVRARFWDTSTYHKLLVQPAGSIAEGTILEYSAEIRIFTADPAGWEEKTMALVKAKRPGEPLAEPGVSGARAERPESRRIPGQGRLLCRTGDYTTRFAADRAWTIYDIRWRETDISLSNGFHGTVMTPKGGKWWGTGHTEGGREIVQDLRLTVDGVERPFETDTEIQAGSINLLKTSMIWKFRVSAEVDMSPEYIVEHTRLEAAEDVDLSVFYMFMHCFPPVTTQWCAELPDGRSVSGPLTSGGGFAVNTDARWVAQFMPDPGLGLLCYTPGIIHGQKSMSKIWDLERYHKYYLQRCMGEVFPAGACLDYTVVVKIVPGENGDWTATRKAAASLTECFPYQD